MSRLAVDPRDLSPDDRRLSFHDGDAIYIIGIEPEGMRSERARLEMFTNALPAMLAALEEQPAEPMCGTTHTQVIKLTDLPHTARPNMAQALWVYAALHGFQGQLIRMWQHVGACYQARRRAETW